MKTIMVYNSSKDYTSLRKSTSKKLKYAPFSNVMMKLKASTKTLIVKI